MTYHVSKDDVHVLCDNESELRIAIAVLNSPASVSMPVEVNAPPWRVGGPAVPYVPYPYPDEDDDPPALTLVPPTESDDSVTKPATVQHVSLSKVHREMLEAIMLFPEGVTTKSMMILLGLTEKQAGGRIQGLKKRGLIERIPGHWSWRATDLARRAKVV